MNREEASNHVARELAPKAEKPETTLILPTIPIEKLGPEERDIAVHFNTLSAELRWFYENGVAVSFRQTKTGYTMNLKAMSSPKKKAKTN